MKKILLSFSFLLCILTPGYFQNIFILDDDFDSDGRKTDDILLQNDQAYVVRTQVDGKIVVGGVTYTSIGANNIMFARYFPDGTIDNSFGINGHVVLSQPPGSPQIHDMEIQSDGKILGVGFTVDQIVIVRLNINGSLDSSFAGTGIICSAFGSTYADAISIEIQNDGKIVVGGCKYTAGFANNLVLRFLPNGTLDNTFDNDGMSNYSISTYTENIFSMDIMPNGCIITGGMYEDTITNQQEVAICKYLPNGHLDSSFATNGAKYLNLSPFYITELKEIKSPSDTLIYATGMYDNGSETDVFLLRLTDSGELDPTFGTGGITITNTQNTNEEADDLIIDSIGQVYVGGYVDVPAVSHFLLLRYTPNGFLDATFDNIGFTTCSFDYSLFDDAYSMCMQADGRIILAGDADLTTGTSQDIALVRYVGLNTNSIPNNFDFKPNVYPNPTKGSSQINFTLSETAQVTIDLLDVGGKIVKTIQNGILHESGNISIPITLTDGINDGIYFVRININSTEHYLKLIKQDY